MDVIVLGHRHSWLRSAEGDAQELLGVVGLDDRDEWEGELDDEEEDE